MDSKFSAIKNRNKERPSFPGQPCQSDHLQVCSFYINACIICLRHQYNLLLIFFDDIVFASETINSVHIINLIADSCKSSSSER